MEQQTKLQNRNVTEPTNRLRSMFSFIAIIRFSLVPTYQLPQQQQQYVTPIYRFDSQQQHIQSANHPQIVHSNSSFQRFTKPDDPTRHLW